MKKAGIIPAIFIALAMTSCRTIKPEKPAEAYIPTEISPKISVISLPIEMKISGLEALLNRQLTGIIYEDNNLEDDNLQVKAWKKENIRLNFSNGAFHYRVPITLWIKAGWKFDRFGITLSDYREMNAEIALNFATTIKINNDWTITTTTQSEGFEWISKPTLKLGPVDLPITMIANIIVKANMGTINTAIDDGLKSSLDLKSTAREAWKEIQKPILLSEEYKLWLRIKPKAISALPISGANGIIRQTTSIQGFAECFAGKQPPYMIDSQLPVINPQVKSADQFTININAYVPFEYLDSISRQQIQNQRFDFGNKHITITGVNVYGSEKELIVETAVEGSIKGKLYFSGIPAYRSADSAIVLNNLQFHIKTRNLLLKTANWLYNGGIEKILQKRLVYPIGSDLRDTYSVIQESLNHYPLGEGFILNGSLDRLEVQQPILAPGSVIAPLLLEGKLMIVLEDASK